MAGILFFKTQNLAQIKAFYTSQLGMTLWLDQGGCQIFQHGNLLLGFCERQEVDRQGIITLFYERQRDVDTMYQTMQPRAVEAPHMNPTYNIYQFFARDPEDRLLEFQAFLHPLAPYQAGNDLLKTRRSIRAFEDTPVPDDLLWKVFDLCRYAPSSMNRQPCYFVVIRNRQTLEILAGVRGSSSAPIAAAPIAVAICVDANLSKRPVVDGSIAAYHFLLAAKVFGLGTCWIAAMDRDDVKAAIQVPQDHVVATITPVGYPAATPDTPPRKDASDFVRFLD
ncbi:nitroreductase [candidate division KSB3 bacterium]|uniref:Nitroreductase n=1 Tax=candidate division KSB3 bacterium TaxID=2044937 RepID=A0A9D5JV81_9BACT|nr:nitroreductase [candidate division KSB3 bacterium]MBD3324775.1 nitroreductase [candidate division KSB3 bacterium]